MYLCLFQLGSKVDALDDFNIVALLGNVRILCYDKGTQAEIFKIFIYFYIRIHVFYLLSDKLIRNFNYP